MSRLATISLVNFPYLPDKEVDRLNKTLLRMGKYIEEAARRKSDLVAFPEICNYMGAAGSWQFESLDGPTITAMSGQARKHGIYVVCPLATLEDGQHYNSSVLISRDGSIVGVYHKNFPTHGELDMGIIPGVETPVFETDFGRVGMCLCFDLNYWEVGAGLCAQKAELVLWSSMWEGGRMLSKWVIEFGFHLGAICVSRSTLVDLSGRTVLSLSKHLHDHTNGAVAPLTTAHIDMDWRLLHHDDNIKRLIGVHEKYGSEAIYTEWLGDECILIFGSNLPDISTDEIISEFGIETMRHYLARARRDRQLALKGCYLPPKGGTGNKK